MNVTFKVIGKTIEEVEKEITEEKIPAIIDRVMNVGSSSFNDLKNFISSNRKREKSSHTDTNAKASKKALEDSFTITEWKDGENFGWGIGEIAKLKKESPHYLFINYGGTPPSTKDYPKLYGHFSKAEGGLFKKGKPYYPIYPTRYNGMNYIENTNESIRNQLDNLFKGGI